MQIKLGLIGDNIHASKSPLLHQVAGKLCGLDVTYERLVPADIRLDFDGLFERCWAEGYRGLNITYPYKERVVGKLHIDDAHVRAIGACNTVLFNDGLPTGFNTDCSGFAAAFVKSFGGHSPGVVAMAGAGGVGKAIGFALAGLNASELRLFDRDMAKAEALAGALQSVNTTMRVTIVNCIEAATQGSDGFVNCTPVGMVGYPGSAFPASLLKGGRWAFDAVYTPVETEFIIDARNSGLDVLSGYELFFDQGVDAFRIFTGCDLDVQALRKSLEAQA